MIVARTPFCLFLVTALSSTSGCLKFDFELGGDRGSDDAVGGDDAIDPDDEELPTPSEVPDRLSQPWVPDALWSVAWYTSTPILAADLGSAGLGLTGGRDATLINLSTGLPIWTELELDDGERSRVRVGDEGMVWARRDDHGTSWELRSYDPEGALVSAVELGHTSEAFVLDDAARPYLASQIQLLGVDPSDGGTLWSTAASPEFRISGLSPRADGVVALEVRDSDSASLDYRLRSLTSDGTELDLTPYTVGLGFAREAVEIGGQLVVLEENFLWSSNVRALEPGTGEELWSVELPAAARMVMAADPVGDPPGSVLVLVAGADDPAELVRISLAGEVVETRAATDVPVNLPILAVGDAGEIVVGGRDSAGVLRLSRLQ